MACEGLIDDCLQVGRRLVTLWLTSNAAQTIRALTSSLVELETLSREHG